MHEAHGSEGSGQGVTGEPTMKCFAAATTQKLDLRAHVRETGRNNEEEIKKKTAN